MDVSQWVWMVLEQARLDLGRLAVWLESASREGFRPGIPPTPKCA